MSDQPEQPTRPGGEPGETVPMRVPKHGRGKLLVAGKPGNAGGGRLATRVLEDLVLVGGLTATEMLERLQDDKRRARISDENLARWLSALAPYLWPRKYEHAGPQGGPIPISNVGEQLRQRLSEKLKRRIELLQPTGREPPTPPPEREHSPVATAPL